jgi:hypothetical protein
MFGDKRPAPIVAVRVGPGGERSLSLRLPQAEDAASGVNYGCLAPISGWVSRKFDEKQPTPTIYWRGRLAGNSVLRSEIAC